MRRLSSLDIIIAVSVSAIAVALGFIAHGLIPSLIFTLGFVGGLFVWLLVESRARWDDIRAPYIFTVVLFLLHKHEEKRFAFFEALAKITGVPPPSADSILAYGLLAVAALWFLIPLLVLRKSELGYYLSWTFFCSMGVTELTHFVFPLMREEPYGYFPGMLSVIVLAPVGWWGILRMIHPRPTSS